MRVAAFDTAPPDPRQTKEEAMMTAEQICNIIVAKNDPMTTTGPQALALVKELFGRVDIATMRAGVELAAAEFERLNERLDEPDYLVAAIIVRHCFMRCCALRVV